MAAKGSGGEYSPGGGSSGRKLYDWGDGKGRVHSRPKKNRQPKTGEAGIEQALSRRARQQRRQDRQNFNSPAFFTQPQSYATIGQEARRADQLRYGPVDAALRLRERQTPTWFESYRADLATPQQVAATYQPMIQAQQGVAQQTAQTTPGIDPNSEAGKTDALAAKAREALVGLGAATLTAQQTADTTYFQGRQGVANAAQIGAMGQLASERQSLARERGDFRQTYITDSRDRERQYGLGLRHQAVEEKAFGLDVAKAAQDAADKANEVNQYGVKNSTWANWSRTRRRKWIADFKKQTAVPGKPGPPDVITSGPLAGKTKKWVANHPQQAAQLVAQYNADSGGTGGGFTADDRRGARKELRGAVALVTDGLKLSHSDRYWKDAYSQLIADKLDPVIAQAAVQMVRAAAGEGSGVGPKTRRRLLREYGIKPWKVKGAKRPPKHTIPGQEGRQGDSGTNKGSGNETARPTVYRGDGATARLARHSPDAGRHWTAEDYLRNGWRYDPKRRGWVKPKRPPKGLTGPSTRMVS